MNEGYWIQRSSGKTWKVDEHCRFAKSPTGSTAMGLPENVKEFIAPLTCTYQAGSSGEGNATDREQVCIAVMKAGYIRMRGHGNQYSFEFWGNTRDSLWVIFEFCQKMAGPYTWIVVNNLKSNEQFAASYQDFEARMQEDEAQVLRIATQLLKNPAHVEASGFPRLMQIMKGVVPTVHTFGIMSPDNPQSVPATKEFNEAARIRFKKMLDHFGYGYVQHTGMYGAKELSFFIPNINKRDLATLQKAFDQETVIFGQVHRGGHGATTTFEMIGAGGVESTRTVVIDETNKDPQDYYSEVKGRKFRIPFFDDAYPDAEGSTESNIPNPFEAKDIPENDQTLPHLAHVYAKAQDIHEDARGLKTGMGSYYSRKSVLSALKAVKRATSTT